MDPEKKSREEVVVNDVPDHLVDGVNYVLMSSGDVIRPEDMSEYLDTFSDEIEHEGGHRDRLETIIISSVAGLGALATALALRRLHRNK